MKSIQKSLFLISGPLLFIILQYLGPPSGMPDKAYDLLSITLWMAIWWVTESVPIAITALLPIILFPMTGAVDLETTTASFGHKYIFLYMGGFMLAIAIEKWNLHKRIALNIIKIIGTNVSKIILILNSICNDNDFDFRIIFELSSISLLISLCVSFLSLLFFFNSFSPNFLL